MHVLSLPPAFVLSQDQTLRLKEDHLAYRSSLITGGHCLFFRNFESPKSCSTSDPVEDLGFYRAARNRTAEVFASSVSARAPELRRPRFSFLYNQLVKEPESRDSLWVGGGRAPHFIQQLRPFDHRDQLRTLKFRRSFYRFVRNLQNREPPYLTGLAAFVKVFF